MADLKLGRIGVFTIEAAIGEENVAEAARLAEQLGYGTFWLGGSPRLPSVRQLLEATDSLVVGTSIVNIWAYEPAQLAAEYAELARDFADRLVVGIGVGHPEAATDYSRPLASMRAFLDGIDDAESAIPPDRRCLAALAPKMLALSAERSLGTIPYFVPVAHTRAARAQLGPDALVAPELTVVLDTDPASARATARGFAERYLARSNYTNNLLRHGFAESDFADSGSDALIDALIPHGTPAQIAAAVTEHLDAGADHVAVQVIGEAGIPRRGWAAVAEAMA